MAKTPRPPRHLSLNLGGEMDQTWLQFDRKVQNPIPQPLWPNRASLSEFLDIHIQYILPDHAHLRHYFAEISRGGWHRECGVRAAGRYYCSDCPFCSDDCVLHDQLEKRQRVLKLVHVVLWGSLCHFCLPCRRQAWDPCERWVSQRKTSDIHEMGTTILSDVRFQRHLALSFGLKAVWPRGENALLSYLPSPVEQRGP